MMEKATIALLSKIQVGDYIRCYRMIFGHPAYIQGFITELTGIALVVDSNCIIYSIDIDKLEITHKDLDLGL